MYKRGIHNTPPGKITWTRNENLQRLIIIPLIILAFWLGYKGWKIHLEPENKPDTMQGWQKPTPSDTLPKEILTPPDN